MGNVAYLKLVQKGVALQGQSIAPGWINWIEVSSVKYEMATPKAGNQVARRDQVVEIVKEFDSVSAALAQALSQNTQFDSMTIDIVQTGRDGKAPERTLRLEFTGLTVAKISTQTPDHRDPWDHGPTTQRVTFKFASAKSTVTPNPHVGKDDWRQ
jgi:type VI secretion system Hcp family effector